MAYIIPRISGLPSPGPGSETAPNVGGPINAPKRRSILDSWMELRKSGILPQFNPIDKDLYPDIKPQTISGLDDSYYTNLADQAKKRLTEQYFSNDNSLSAQLKNQMNKRGLIGSGIEAGATSSLYKDFGSQLSDFESQLAYTKSMNDKDIEKFNVQNLIDSSYKNRDFGLNLDKYNTDTGYKVTELGLGAAGDETTSANNFNSSMFGTEVNQRNNDQKQIGDQISQLTQIYNNKDADPEMRKWAGDIIASYHGGTFGVPYNSPKNTVKPASVGSYVAPSESGAPPGYDYEPGTEIRNASGTWSFNGLMWLKIA